MSEGRTRILEAARSVFLEGGAEAVTMRRVAERVGVTPTALYRHYDDKKELLNEVIAAGFETFGGYLVRSLQGRTPKDRLERSGTAYLSFALEQPETYRTLFMVPVPGGSRPVGDPGCSATTFRFLTDRVRECMESGELHKDDPEAVAVAIWAHVHGLVSLYLTGALGMDEAEFRRAYQESVGRLFRGL